MNNHTGARRRSAWPGLLAGALLVLGAQATHAAEGRCSLKMMEMPVKMVGNRAIATVGINGTQVPLMVDSGAFFSMLHEAAAAQLKLKLHPLPFGMQLEGLTGKIDAQATVVDHLQLFKGDLPDVDFVVGGNDSDVGSMGMMGRNLLAFTDIEYDLAHGMIRFVFPSDECAHANMAYWAGDTPVSDVPLIRKPHDRLPAIRAVVELNGHKETALFDTGATTTVSLYAAHQAGVKDADMKPFATMTGAGRGKAQAWTAPFERVELAGEAVLHNRLEVGDFSLEDADMLIGIDFFLSHRIYVSKKRSRMFFTYNGGPVFALNVGAPPAEAASGAASPVPDTLVADELAGRGAASRARGDLAAALADLDRACAMEPGNAGFFFLRAQIHGQRRDVDKTIADIETTLRLDPTLGEARMLRAWVRFAHHDRDLALADLAELDRTLPPQASSRAEMAALYAALDLPEQVIAQWNQWIAAHPHDRSLERAWNERCWARMALNIELDKAMDDCDRAVDADDKNPSFLDSRAWVYLRQGKPKKALADFDRGLRIKPEGLWSLYGRGQAHLALGDATLGQADLAAARARDGRVDELAKKAGLPVAPH